ncbi:MAG TPA: hypothetical protein DIW47_00975 [Bacteroidetes bacterium]|nr:hypothetical protein [Bacteroidota bacterium]
MKKAGIRSIVVGILFLLVSNPSKGHGPQAEITYRWLSSGKYEFTIKAIHECSGLPLSQSNLTARSTTGGKVFSISSQTLVSVVDVSGISPNCPDQSNCSGGSSPYGYELYTWTALADFTSYSECEWTVSWEQCCRDGNITTGQSGEIFFTFTKLNTCIQNSSPVFESLPIRYVCYNQFVGPSQKAVDRYDLNDSITYHLVNALTSATASCTYSGNFSPTRPLTFFGWPNQNLSSPAGFHLDPINGVFQFRPTGLNQVAVICMEVKEWRRINGVMTHIGSIRRDMTVDILNCGSSPNNNPSIQSISREQEVCIKDSFCFDIQTTDPDGDTTVIYWDSTVQGAKFYTTNKQQKHAKGTFCWKPLNHAVSDTPYYFAVTVYDDRCPFSGRYTTTFKVFVRDSADGPSVDIGPDIIDSTGLDSFYVQGTLNDYGGQALLWTSSGDGEFQFPDSASSYYFPGELDKKTCSYSLMLEIKDPTPCLGDSKLIDTLEVSNVLKNFNAGPDAPFFPSDTLTLNASGDTGRAWTYRWIPNGRVWIEDSSSFATRILPGDSAVYGCEFELVLMAMACDTLYDTVRYSRAFLPIDAGPDQPVLFADSISLHAVSTSSLQKGYWRSNGAGYFSDSLSPNSVYFLASHDDYAACELTFIWQELPAAQCFVNADTVLVSTVFTGLYAGADKNLDLDDTAVILASPVFGWPVFGHWRSLGDGAFWNSTNFLTFYYPGPGDKASCEVALIWSYPYPACSSEEDTMLIHFNYASAQAGMDQQIAYGDTLYLMGSPSAPGAEPNFWSTLGDGQLEDSLDHQSAYYPGPLDWENCGGTLVIHAPYPQCGGGTDTLNWNRLPFVLNAGADMTTTADSFPVMADPIDGGKVAGWWSSVGDGYFKDSNSVSSCYYPGPLETKVCEGILFWNAPYSVCTPEKDTLKWQRVSIPVEAGSDQIIPLFQDIILKGKSTAQQVRWETNGSGRFLDSSSKATVYYPSPLDYPLCSLNFVLRELEQQCGLGMDDVNVNWLEEGIKIEKLRYDPCFMDSIEIVLNGNMDLNLTWTGNGSGNFYYDTTASKWFYILSPDDYSLGIFHFNVDAKGYCLQTRDSLILITSFFGDYREHANSIGPIKVYPNPSTDWLTINGTCPVDVVSVKVYNMLGQQLQNWPIQELPFVFSVESLATGVYILHIEMKNGRVEKVPVTKFQK